MVRASVVGEGIRTISCTLDDEPKESRVICMRGLVIRAVALVSCTLDGEPFGIVCKNVNFNILDLIRFSVF